MKKTKETPEKRCPVCGKTQNQAKKGFNKSGTQKVFCKECGRNYTIDPKSLFKIFVTWYNFPDRRG
jgi:transposase-like protein